jgi:hypothetical protein
MRFSRVFSIEIFFSQPFLPEISPSFILNEISALSQMRFLHGAVFPNFTVDFSILIRKCDRTVNGRTVDYA